MRFEDALKLAGLVPRDIVADGKRRRCPTEDKPHRKNGQYVLLPDGQTGFWRNFVDGLKWQVWHDDAIVHERKVDPVAEKARRDAARQERVANIMAARDLWEQCKDYRVHPYLESKGLTAEGCQHLRLWRGSIRVQADGSERWTAVQDTWLIVPIRWRDRVVNLQRIGSDGLKRQMKGWVPGSHLMLSRPTWAVTVICEGLATGLAIYQSMRHARVVVAFFADNLLPVVQEIKPTGSVVIAADNDHATMARRGFNPGIDKATNAASLIGAGVSWPKGIEGSDWADALHEWGRSGGRKLEREILAAAKFVMETA